MRINRKKITLIIASLCGTGSSTIASGQEFTTNSPASSVGRIGDGGVATQGPSPVASNSVDSEPAAFQPSSIGDSMSAGQTGGEYYNPTMQTVSYGMTGGGTVDGSCGGACGNANYGTSFSNGYSNGCNVCNGTGHSRGWLESETLLWWGKAIPGVPLVVGGSTPEATPTTVLAGGQDQPLGTNLLVGMRLNAGKWLDCNQNYGVGARGWGILTNGTTENYTNGGNSTGVPFFNTFANSPSVYNVNEAQAGQGANTGTIQVKNDLDLVAAELYGRTLLARTGNSRVDLLGGYTFVRMDSELGLRTQVTDGLSGNPIQNGTITTTQDNFGTKNQFHGGHIGLLQELTKGRFTFTALGKVALGNMNQSSSVSGQFSTANTASPITEPQGLFARNSNIGTITRNQFTFLPEAGAKIKYQFGRAQFGVGYTMLLFPSVAMAGSQVDPVIDPTNSAPLPPPRLVTEAFFLHGLDLGVTFNF